MRSALNVVRCRGMPIIKQLQAEEVLLRHTNESWFILNRDMNDVSVVMGFSGKASELIDLDHVRNSAAQGKNIKIIRRYTGGGTVIVDNATIFTSFIMNAADVPSRPYPRDIMSWSETIFKPAFEGGSVRPGAVFSLRENDYVIDNLKIGGNAQSIVKDRWVHHTSFLWDYTAENMQFLLMPKKRPDYRGDRSHTKFLDKICNHMKSPTDMEDRILAQLQLAFDVNEVSSEALEIKLNQIARSSTFLKQPDVRTRIEDINTLNEISYQQAPTTPFLSFGTSA